MIAQLANTGEVVGTYRMLVPERARRGGGAARPAARRH